MKGLSALGRVKVGASSLAALNTGRPVKERKRTKPRVNRQLPDDTVAQMKKDLHRMSIRQVADKYGKPYYTVRDIYLGITYADVREAL